MRISRRGRFLAVVLCCQPVFWVSGPALAQTLDPQGALQAQPFGGASTSVPPLPSSAGSDPGILRAERPALAGERVGTPAPLDQPVDPDTYVCGPGDVLDLNFWGLQSFRLRATVDLEGRAFVQRIGYLPLRGKTLTEARRLLRESVARYYPNLQFDAALTEPRTFLVQVVDAVAHPGSYQARAVDRVAALVARAGGLSPRASRRRVEIQRRDGSVVRADLLQYELTGDVRQNPFLLDGDVVRVPFEELSVAVNGAVNRPGRYELTGKRDLAELVGLAGGTAPAATTLLPVTVVRRAPDDTSSQLLLDFGPGGALPEATLQHEDAVRIPSYEELHQSIMVVGAIAGATAAAPLIGSDRSSASLTPAQDETGSTRRLPFVHGDSVRTLIDRVGGVGPLADLSGTYLVRKGEAVPVDLHALLMLRDLKADRPIELGDTLVIPFKRRNVVVEGAVFTPGAYPFHPTYGIDQYLSLAGGRNRFATDMSDVRLVTPQGETKQYSPDLKVEPGSTLVVPERNFSRSEVVQIVLSAAAIILSGVTLYVTVKK